MRTIYETAIADPTPGACRLRTGEDALHFLGSDAGGLLIDLGRHHPYTGRHSLRVANLAALCAEQLGMSRSQVQLVTRAALLHDVGKLDVPPETLDGAKPLTASEWDTVKQHPVGGEHRLMSISGHEQAALIVRSHHERVDGGGYPDGLAADQIPMAARIIAVCDAYEAMTAPERAYQQALAPAAAQAVIRAGVGTQFDANVSDAFLDTFSHADELETVALATAELP